MGNCLSPLLSLLASDFCVVIGPHNICIYFSLSKFCSLATCFYNLTWTPFTRIFPSPNWITAFKRMDLYSFAIWLLSCGLWNSKVVISLLNITAAGMLPVIVYGVICIASKLT